MRSKCYNAATMYAHFTCKISSTSFRCLSFFLFLILHFLADLDIIAIMHFTCPHIQWMTRNRYAILTDFNSIHLKQHMMPWAHIWERLSLLSTRYITVCLLLQVTWLVVTEVRSESFGLVTQRRHDIGVPCTVSHTFAYWTSFTVTHIIFFT